ncbi:MAG: glycosyltransferase [Spirochaetota bacterium]
MSLTIFDRFHRRRFAENRARTVTLLMVSYNYPNLLSACLSSLLATRDEQPFTLLIIDNDSVPETKRILAEYEAAHDLIRVIHLPENVNFVKALKIGLAEVKTDHCVTIQTDMTFPNRTWLRYMIERYEDGTLLFINQRHPDDGKWCYGFCFLIDTATYRTIGVNDRFTLACEDWDFMNRLVASRGTRALVQSRGPFVWHRTCYIRQRKEGDVTASIEANDIATYASIWGTTKEPRHRMRSV